MCARWQALRLPRAFDRRIPEADKDPLRNNLDYENPLADIAGRFGGLFGGLFGNLTQGITDLATSIANAVAGGAAVVTGIFGSVIQTAFDAVFGIFSSANNAQSTGDAALAETALIKAALEGVISGGAVFTEDFEGAQSTTLAGYTQVSIGGGTGTYGRKDGYGHWFTAFSVDQTIISVHATDVLNTSTQRIAIKLKTRVLHSERAVWLILRPNAAGTDACFVRINPTNFQYGYMIGGAITYLGTVSGGASTDGQLWQFEIGEAGAAPGTNDWLWKVVRSAGETWSAVDDPSQPTLLDSSHRCRGFAASARNEFGAQKAPPDLEVITWADI